MLALEDSHMIEAAERIAAVFDIEAGRSLRPRSVGRAIADVDNLLAYILGIREPSSVRMTPRLAGRSTRSRAAHR